MVRETDVVQGVISLIDRGRLGHSVSCAVEVVELLFSLSRWNAKNKVRVSLLIRSP